MHCKISISNGNKIVILKSGITTKKKLEKLITFPIVGQGIFKTNDD